MNEENNFSIDVNAEMQSFNFDESKLDITPSEFLYVQEDEKLADGIIPSSMEVNASITDVQQQQVLETEKIETQSISLSKTDIETLFAPIISPQPMEVTTEVSSNIPLTPMEVDAQIVDPVIIQAAQLDMPKQLGAEKASTNIPGMNIKMDANDALNATQNVAKQVGELRENMGEVANSIKNSWIPTRETDQFEERPTLEATNLLFEDRKIRMMAFPEWS